MVDLEPLTQLWPQSPSQSLKTHERAVALTPLPYMGQARCRISSKHAGRRVRENYFQEGDKLGDSRGPAWEGSWLLCPVLPAGGRHASLSGFALDLPGQLILTRGDEHPCWVPRASEKGGC